MKQRNPETVSLAEFISHLNDPMPLWEYLGWVCDGLSVQIDRSQLEEAYDDTHSG